MRFLIFGLVLSLILSGSELFSQDNFLLFFGVGFVVVFSRVFLVSAHVWTGGFWRLCSLIGPFSFLGCFVVAERLELCVVLFPYLGDVGLFTPFFF